MISVMPSLFFSCTIPPNSRRYRSRFKISIQAINNASTGEGDVSHRLFSSNYTGPYVGLVLLPYLSIFLTGLKVTFIAGNGTTNAQSALLSGPCPS
jgi:hypothetical protein